MPMSPAPTSTMLTDPESYSDGLAQFVTDSPSSYHAAAAIAAALDEVGFLACDESTPWDEVPLRGYVVRDGAVAAWMLPREEMAASAGWRIVGSHTDSPALKLKPQADVSRAGWQLINAEVYGGPLDNSFLDRELGLAGRLSTVDGRVHLVRTGPIARVAQVAPHLRRESSLTLDRQEQLLPLWCLSGEDAPESIEAYLCELAGVDLEDLAGHDILTFPTQEPSRFGARGEFLASSRLDNLSSVFPSLVAMCEMARGDMDVPGPTMLIAFDHEEVGSGTRSGACGPFLQSILERVSAALGYDDVDSLQALYARSSCVSADAGHSVHPNYASLHDPSVRPLINHGPMVKINAQQRYASDATGEALWERACRAAEVPHQRFVGNNSVPCGTTIGPLTAQQLGITTVDVGVALLSMHSQREMCGIKDGPWMAQALRAYWLGL